MAEKDAKAAKEETKAEPEKKEPEKKEYSDTEIATMADQVKAAMAAVPEGAQKKVLRKAGVAKTGSITGAIFTLGTAHGVYEHLRAEGGNNTVQAVATGVVTGFALEELGRNFLVPGVKAIINAIRS